MILTEEQKKIIEHSGSHAKVMAVAGSGKTTTMVERILHLIKSGQNPKRILVLMFNASAASEFTQKMKTKAIENGISGDLPEVRTFHAMALKLCNYLVGKNILPNYKLETKEWIFHKMADESLASFIGESKGRNRKEIQESFYQFIDLVNSDIISSNEKLKEIPDILETTMPKYFSEAYEDFNEKRQKFKIRFFSDIIKDPVLSILNDSSNISYIENIYDHVILDEYQDINEVQQRMTKFIAGKRAEVMAVGDADQCIYEWRGAKPEYIVNLFETDFPNSKKFTLSRTYRYGDELSLFVNNIITINNNRDNKICISHENTPNTTVEMKSDNKNIKVSNIVSFIKNNINDKYNYSDFSILLRKFSMSLMPELDLIKNQIPYVLVGSNSVFKRNEILAIEGFSHIVNNSFNTIDQEHQREVIESFLKIPYSGIKTEEASSIANKIIKYIASNSNDSDEYIVGLLELQGKKCRRKISSIKKAKKNLKMMNSFKILNDYVESNDFYSFFDRFSSTNKIAEEKETLVVEFLNYAKKTNFKLNEFIEDWVNMFYQSNDMVNNNIERVLITSIHRSKGLEWPFVIIPELIDDKFPGLESEKMFKVDESERRLFYVGATRAINKLLLLHPKDPILDDWKRKTIQPHPMQNNFESSRYLFEGYLKEVKKVSSLIRGEKTFVKVVEKDLYARYFSEKNLSLNIKSESEVTTNKKELGDMQNFFEK